MTNQRFTFRKTADALTVDVYLRFNDTYLGQLQRGRGTYHLTGADGTYYGESAISRDTAAGALVGYAADRERERLAAEAAPAPAEAVSLADALSTGIVVTDNTGRTYTARILTPGSPYGNSGTWGGAFYQEGRIGVTIDGTPATYNADGIAKLGDRPFPGPLAIDSGAGWLLTEQSTAAFVALAKQAMTLAGLS